MYFKTTTKLYNLRFYCIAAQFLDMNPNEFKSFILKKNLQGITIPQLQRTEKFFKESGFQNKELMEHAAVFSVPFHIWDQKLNTLKEGGFTKISLPILLKFRSLLSMSITSLKKEGHIPRETVVPKLLLTHLETPSSEIRINDLVETSTFSNIHKNILTRYLVKRFGVQEDRIISVFRIHKRINLKSLNDICWNINFALSIGYSYEKILKNMYILCTCPKNTKEVLKEVPQLLSGVDVKYKMFIYPKLIGISFDFLHNIYKILKKHGIKDEAIIKSMNIFTLSANTVERRLQEMQKDAELRVLLYEPLILNLVIHFNKAKYRLKVLHEYNMKCTTVAILGGNSLFFEEYIKDGKDKNYDKAVFRFINRLLKCDIEIIRDKLRNHPYFNHVPLVSILDSYRYLKSLQFKESDLQEVMQLLLYSRYKIKEGYQKCKEYCDREGIDNIDNIQILNLTLYFIEKDYHFTGDGIWVNEENLS